MQQQSPSAPLLARMKVGFLAILLGVVAMARGDHPETPTTLPTGAAVVIQLDGEINDFSTAAMIKRFGEAKRLGAKTVILRINTWGGMVTSALDTSHFLKNQPDLHIIAFVDDKAISAGSLIAVACDEIVMEPGSMIGDCAPIVAGGKLEGAERAKAESVILADFYASAARNGLDQTLVASMVQYQRVVHYIQNSAGERKFVDGEAYAKLQTEGWTAVEGVPNPIDGADQLLTVNNDLAKKLGLSRGTFADVQALASERQLNVVATLAPSGGDAIIDFLNGPVVRGLVGVFFMLSLYAAFHAPGHGAAEAICLICLTLMLGVPMLTGYAQWYEILAILTGMVLLALELFVIPGFGVAGISGIVLVLGGLIMTFVPREPSGLPGILPDLPSTYAALKQGVLVVTGGLVTSMFLAIWLQRYLPSMPYLNRLILSTPNGAPVDAATAELRWPMVGDIGRAATDLKPGGSAMFFDPATRESRMTDVVSDSGYVSAGSSVVVREHRGSYAIVRATVDASSDAGGLS